MTRRRSEEDTEDEAVFWEDYLRGVTPLRKTPVPRRAIRQGVGKPVSAPAPVTRPFISASPLQDFSKLRFDRSVEHKLRRGDVALDGTLDLHGMTQDRAYAALHRFILCAAREGRRTLLIITGKGRFDETGERGILKRMTPRWLEAAELAPHILTIRAAAPRHGGDGAIYVLMKRHKGRAFPAET